MSVLEVLRRRRRDIPHHVWGTELRRIDLPRDGAIQWAQWQHPLETPTKLLEQAEIDGVRTIVKPGDFVIDIGAYTGDTTLPLGLAAGKQGCVLAVEANPFVYAVLERNAQLNPERTNIIPRCFAAVEQPGKYTFHYGDASFCNGGMPVSLWRRLTGRLHPLEVEGVDLANVLRAEYANWLPKLSFIKVDAEGHDYEVLRSLREIIAKYRPTIRAEVFRYAARAKRRDLYNFLTEQGYAIHRWEGGGKPRGRELATASDMNRELHFDVLATPE
jgi:FkbM family methyltransferase